MGDINIDILQYGKDRITNDYVNCMFSHNFSQCINRPTRISRTTATLIDHIWSNRQTDNIKSGILLTDHSDHFSPYVCRNEPDRNDLAPAQAQTITYRDYGRSSPDQVHDYLSDKLSTFELDHDVHASYLRLLKILQQAMDDCYPLKTIQLKPKSVKKNIDDPRTKKCN